VIWETNGDGIFDDINLPGATYHPGELDKLNGGAEIQMQVLGFSGCPVTVKNMKVNINSLPVIPLPSDTIISSGNSVVLDAAITAEALYSWAPSGSISPSIEVDSTASQNGTKSTIVTVTNSFGCTASKEIFVHFNSSGHADVFNIFPNPSNGNFVLRPESGTAVVSSVKLLGMDGKLLWSNTEGFTILEEKKIEIPGLFVGIYFLATYTTNGLSVNKVYIR
jgi:hypothetical protein